MLVPQLLVAQRLRNGDGSCSCCGGSGSGSLGSLHDGVHGAGLLAEAAVDALGHVNVVPAVPAEERGSVW